MMCQSRNWDWKPRVPYGPRVEKSCQKKAQGGLGIFQDKLDFVPCQKVARQLFSERVTNNRFLLLKCRKFLF